MTKPKRRSAGAVDQLHRQLATLAAQGRTTPCMEYRAHLWLSDDIEDRRIAVKLCRGCPLVEPCGQAAESNSETFGVWGGKDRTPRPKSDTQDEAA